ncbi:MAG: nucleotide exchange factor GrpE [Terracidiphilus sp.]
MPEQETESTAEAAAQQNEASPPGEATAQPEPEAAQVSREEFERVKAANQLVKEERDQLLDRLARLQAEFENARKRAERERQEFREYAVGSVVEQFLPVLDNFELALKSAGTAEQLRSGVELIVKQMQDILRQMHVQPVPAMGEAFDPRQHEALGSVEREDLPDQHVAEEIRRGYKLRDRLLRPSLVRVASNPKQTSE